MQEKIPYCVGGLRLYQVSQSGSGVPILGDIQNLPGHCPGTAAVVNPA